MRTLLIACAALAAAGGCSLVQEERIEPRARVARPVVEQVVDCAAPVPGGAITATPVAASPISDAPGKTLTSVRLDVPAGAKSNPHRHAGLVYVYVLEGAVCSQITGDAQLRPYTAGQTFFEVPGTQHLGFTNPTSMPAKVLVTFVHDTGATLTAPLQ